MAGTDPTTEPVAGSEGRLVRTVERLPDGRRLTRYASPSELLTPRPPDEGGRGASGATDEGRG